MTNVQASLRCDYCDETFPVIDGIPRMLLTPMREAMMGSGPGDGADARQVATAQSFGFEWSRFPEMRDEWERNFLEYMAPHAPEFFQGKRVLDAGCGSGRHAFYAAQYGAEVWAIDLGPAVQVARRNTDLCQAVHVVQADLYKPPFAPESFDFIYSLGVLHHLPDPEAGFRNLLRYLKPGGTIQVFLYWEPEGQPLKRRLVAATSAVRRMTTRLPYRAVHALSYPAAWVAFGLFVWPYLALRRIPGLRQFAERIPMKQYARYPFRVCVNDQFDRLSAPIENRYTRAEVEAWLVRVGLEDVIVRPNCGWVATGRKPVSALV
jgi:SAM-dependent methyltransferase